MKGISAFSANVHKGMAEKKKNDEEKYLKQKEVEEVTIQRRAPSGVTDYIKSLYPKKTIGIKNQAVDDKVDEKYSLKKGMSVPRSY